MPPSTFGAIEIVQAITQQITSFSNKAAQHCSYCE